jgi:hypothetical protein
LERADTVIACEVSVTTTIDHEIRNIRKCINAGFTVVAVICIESDRLKKIAAAVRGSLGPDATARVQYWQPEDFIAHLQALAAPAAPPPQTKVRRGYKVKRSVETLSPEEQKRREDAAIQSIAEAMRRKKQP